MYVLLGFVIGAVVVGLIAYRLCSRRMHELDMENRSLKRGREALARAGREWRDLAYRQGEEMKRKQNERSDFFRK